jgi:hypothetical protein
MQAPETVREQAIDLLWAQAQETLYITKEQFTQSLEGWTLDSVLRDDASIGAVFVSRGPEFHFATFGGDIQATRAHLKKYPGELIAIHGYAITRTPKTDTRMVRFNQRLGFYAIGQDEFDVHMRIDQLRKKGFTCQ